MKRPRQHIHWDRREGQEFAALWACDRRFLPHPHTTATHDRDKVDCASCKKWLAKFLPLPGEAPRPLLGPKSKCADRIRPKPGELGATDPPDEPGEPPEE